MIRYYRLCKGLNDIGELCTEEEIKTKIKDRTKDWYSSIYFYTEEQKKEFNRIVEKVSTKTGEVYQGKNGAVGINDLMTTKLVWDFDSETNISKAKEDALTLVARLLEYGIPKDAIQVYFSGYKGFAIVLETDKLFRPNDFKKITKELAKGLATFDPIIWNPARIFREPFTIHPKSGLYKITLSIDELSELTSEQIKELASREFEPELPDTWVSIKLPDSVFKLKYVSENTVKETSITINKSPDEICDLNFEDTPIGLTPAKYAILNGYFPSGTRDYALMILGATYRGLKYPKGITYRVLKGAADAQANRFNVERFSDREIFNNIINTIYGPQWKGGTYSEDSFPDNLKEYLKKIGVPFGKKENGDVITIDVALDQFKDYAVNIHNNLISLGMKEIDEKLMPQVGQLFGFLAPPGLGKTTWLIQVMRNISLQGLDSIFFSFDMYKHDIIKKLITRELGFDTTEINRIYVEQDAQKLHQISEALKINYGNIFFNFRPTSTLKAIEETIDMREQQIGRKVKFVGIDYLELIQSQYADPTAASMETIQGLRALAHRGICVFVLLQPNKMSSKPNEPLLSYNSAKGSSSIAQSVTGMLTAHRVGYSSETPENDKFFSINCVKNRNGPLFSADYGWSGERGIISELTHQGRQELKELRQMLATMEKLNNEL